MKNVFHRTAWADYIYWFETDRKTVEKINALIKDCVRNPFTGLGKPEPLRGEYAGWWSRRIDDEHRMVYRVRGRDEDRVLEIMQLRFHYRK